MLLDDLDVPGTIGMRTDFAGYDLAKPFEEDPEDEGPPNAFDDDEDDDDFDDDLDDDDDEEDDDPVHIEVRHRPGVIEHGQRPVIGGGRPQPDPDDEDE